MRKNGRRAGAVLVVAALLTVPAGPAAGQDAAVGGPRLATSAVVVGAGAPSLPEGLTAASWLVADLESGQVLAAKDPHGRYAPASTLKTLTALALAPALPAGGSVVPTYDDVAVEGSKVGLLEGVPYPKDELLSALMMVSGNDAANALATGVGGQVQAAALMNAKAAELGALDTRAVNPHGLDAEGQTSSAYDLALIARAGMQDADFRRWSVTRRSTITGKDGGRFEIVNHNKLLTNYEGALGIKNGYTSRARASFVGAAERGGRTLVVTLMKADPKVWAEAGRLLDWGFSALASAPVGVLVEPEVVAEAATDAPALAAAGASRTADGALVVPAAGGPGDGGSTHWLAVLGGLALAAGAVASVRHDPAPRPAGAPARPVRVAPAAAVRPTGRPLPVQRRAPAPLRSPLPLREPVRRTG